MGYGDRLLMQTARVQAQGARFQLEEATIDDVHRAIRERQSARSFRFRKTA